MSMDPSSHATESERDKTVDGATYTCPMHPEIKRSEPGSCPICGMTLVAASKG